MGTREERFGPKLRVIREKLTCDACSKHRAEYYCVEDGNDCDSGYNHYCDAMEGRSLVGVNTPDWCPAPKPTMQSSCSTCRFSRVHVRDELAQRDGYAQPTGKLIEERKCHRRAPLALSTDGPTEFGGVFSVWPYVADDEWCGEHEAEKGGG